MVFHKSYRDAVFRFLDGGVENTFLTVANGDLTIKFVQERMDVMDRGSLHEVKMMDQGPAEVSFSYKLQRFGMVGTAPSVDTAYEIVTNTGDGANWVSTRSDTDVFCVNVKMQLLDKDGNLEEAIDVDDFYYTSIDVSEGDVSTITISGRGFVTLPTVT